VSGIAGILHVDGAPIDPAVLARITAYMSFRGPHGCHTWISGAAGFGHALLRTSPGNADVRQPCSAGGDLWVVADCRLDGRNELIAQLDLPHGSEAAERPDAELIAHAYSKWGSNCVRHLLGDFAFAVWDRPRRRLFCARDHLGVKPFYYARRRDVFVFSNTLDAVRQHPDVSDALDDGAIGDFLLFDRHGEASATAFADIRRLPAAHALTLAAGRLTVERYWSLPTEGRTRYRDAKDYTGRFAELLMRAVGERLPCDGAGMLMSGGVDSTAVATTARRMQSSGVAPVLRGYTFVYDRLLRDDERHYAGLAAGAIRMPIEFWPMDDYALFGHSSRTGSSRPEPYHWPLDAATLDLYRHMSKSFRVALTGEGGDPLSYFGSLLNTPGFHRLLPAAVSYAVSRRKRPPLGLRTKARRIFGGDRSAAVYPEWVNPDFAARMDVRGRFEHLRTEAAARHPTHAHAYAMLSSPHWTWMFETLDPGATRVPLEFRHPLFDIRLIEYVLAIPLVPWSIDKELLRSVSVGLQPDQVRRRRKSPLGADPIAAHLRNGLPADIVPLTAERLAEYVDVEKVPRALGHASAERRWIDLRPVSLNLWLQRVESPAQEWQDSYEQCIRQEA
jgi:asparagine synthase (glutamine-hydrolysing)